jgi:Outer membrane cobalamin receptor protein
MITPDRITKTISQFERTLINFSARIRAYRWISLEGGINNIFDKNYAISEGFPEAGRNYFLNLVFNNL